MGVGCILVAADTAARDDVVGLGFSASAAKGLSVRDAGRSISFIEPCSVN